MPQPVPATASSARVLVVDDDPIELRLLGKYLGNSGYNVLTAKNGAQGLRIALEMKPALIITDWMMPEMDGLALCEALRKSELGRETHVIMLTSHEDEDRLVEAMDTGADDYLVKPPRPRTLLARVRAGLRVIHLQQELSREKEELRRFAAELAVANRKLEQIAFTDALTGLPNRRYAMEHFQEEWDKGTRSHEPLSCMLIDIDHFKRINDTYGHDAGDIVLQETAALLLHSVRAPDAVCRLGGEEFLVICPSAHLDAARSGAERLRSTVESNIIANPSFNGRVALSIGIAVRQPGMSEVGELLKAADQAVYAAKQAGRNRVCAAGVV